MRIVKQHRRTAIAVGALTTALAMGVASLVVAQLPDGDNTIKDRVLDLEFINGTQAAAPDQTIDPASTCIIVAATCELWAKEDTINVKGVGDFKVWGYATSAAASPTLPGPVIEATIGQPISVKIHNALPAVAGAMGFTARSMDVAARTLLSSDNTDATETYTFTPASAGTSVYSASADSPAGNRQIAMGLAGALVVRPFNCPGAAMGCAYGDPLDVDIDGNHLGSGSTLDYDVGTDVFNGEALIATNEIDPNLNNAANPATFDMTTYRPTVHLINGKAYPDTQVIDAYPGANILVRYANLGLADHSMGLVGAHQRTIGRDGSALPHGSDDVTIPLNVGQTADVMVAIPTPAGPQAGYRYVLADQSRQPGNKSADAAMTFLTVWGEQTVPGQPVGNIDDLVPPADETTGADPMPFTYTNPAGATAAQWSIDDPGLVAFPLDMSGTGEVDITTLSGLVNGTHILWVQWSTDGVTFGDPAGIAFTIDRAGPVVSPIDLDPMYSNGEQDVNLAATADSTLTGTGVVDAAVYTIDSCPSPDVDNAIPTGVTMDSNGPAPVVALTGVIPAGTLTVEGRYQVNVQALDNRGTWSNNGQRSTDTAPPPGPQCGTGELVIDTHAPNVLVADVSPNNNDGTMAFPTLDSYLPVVRITATVSDVVTPVTNTGSGIAAVEGFIEDGLQPLPTPALYGTGFLFTPVDGNFDSSEEAVYADIPLASVATLAPGEHRIWIHGQDLAGSWGSVADAATTLTTVNTLPQLNDVFVDGTSVTITGVANGTGVTVTAYEYVVGPDPAPLLGTNPANVHLLNPLDQQAVVNFTLPDPISMGVQDNIAVRIQDSEGNWSAARLGKATVGGLTVTWSNNAHTRQRLQGFAIPPAGGTVDRIGWSASATTLPAAADGTNITGTSFNYQTNNNTTFGPNGSQLWVRARDASGVWGPAVAVQLPA